MHFWQAIKMAFKSLSSNKLRSFLTMLGIIIGVLTVSLLTTVTSAVSDAIVSSIRSQSTLAIVMSTSKNINYGEMSQILNSNRPENKDDEKYYDYSMVISTNRVIAKDLTGKDISDTSKANFNDVLQFENLSRYDELANGNLSDTEKKFLAGMKQLRKKTIPISSTIYAVDPNFEDVYAMDFTGNFPQKSDEILVDKEFVKTYVGSEYDENTAIGQEVSVGVEYHTDLVFKFTQDVSGIEESVIKPLCEYITRSIDVGGTIINSLTIIENEDGSQFRETGEREITISVNYTQSFTDNEIAQRLRVFFLNPELATYLDSAEDAIKVVDVFDAKNFKTYKISGVLSDDNASIMGMGSSDSDSDDENLITLLMSANQKGRCYMLLDKNNFAPLGIGTEDTNLDKLPISYAYLRYKTENVMDDSTTDIMFALMGSQKGFMTDFMIVSMSSVASIIATVMNILTTMLTVISVISLVVGGIGIMNIMLVAVSERTREIGIRKAIGAKRSSILVQFLVEALMLSLVGGAIGLALSAIASTIIANVMGIQILMPFWVIAMSIGFCTAIGLIFGMFPAVKASKMQPIDALRRE